MVGFVPTIVGSKHNTPKSMVHFKHEETGGSIYLLQIKATAKSDSWVAHLLVVCLPARSSVAIARNINNSFLQK